MDEARARREISECDKELANFRAALRAAPSDTVALWIAETEARRRAAEIRLARSTPDTAWTAEEILAVVQQLNGLVAILDDADTDQRRQVYAATGLTIEYDHQGQRARLSSTPAAEVWSSVRVGGANATLNPRHRSRWIAVDRAA